MRIFLSVLILIFSFQSLTNADDVNNFEISGYSVGQSLLDFKKKSIIETKEKQFMPSSSGEKFYRIAFKIENENYDFVAFYLKKNDNKYIIHSLEGLKYIKYSNCKKKIMTIKDDLINNFNNKYVVDEYEQAHDFDQTKKSKVKVLDFVRSDDYTISRIICTDWSKKLEEKGYYDNLAIYLQSEEFSLFMKDEAYN